MAFGIRYTGTFYSTEGVKTCADILVDGYNGAAQELCFRGDEPLTVEWEETGKEDVVCGSVVTLGIISPGDRTYTGLYTVKAGAIRLDVYRDDALYWRGALDPEFYEEPYSSYDGYEVELTFSDFGMLERLKYNLTGPQTLKAILSDALNRIGLGGMTTDESMITTGLTAGGRMTLDDLSVRSDNFTNEEGEKSDLREVTEGILQPLGLRMIQKGGTVYVYDLNGLYSKAATEEIYWKSDDQTLGVDKAANRVKVTFSPYAKSTLSDSATYTGSTGASAAHAGEQYEYHDIHGVEDWKNGVDEEDISFDMLTSSMGSGLTWIDTDKVRYFEMKPVLGGEECQGVARRYVWWNKVMNWMEGLVKCWYPALQLWNPSGESDLQYSNWAVMKAKKVWIPPMSVDEAKRYRIRIKLEMMVDTRLTPSEDAGEFNNKSEQDDLTSRWNAACVELSVNLTDKEGNVKASWDNAGEGYPKSDRVRLYGGVWKTGSAATTGRCRLEYYDKEDLYDGCGIGGWKSNRPSIVNRSESGNKNKKTLSTLMKQIDDGDYAAYPPQGGYLEITVLSTLKGYEWTDASWRELDASAYKNISWILYKAPEVSIMTSGLKADGVESDDISYSGRIDSDAKDDIDIDTICGTMAAACPTAKGVYLLTSTGEQVRTLSRAGRTTQVEKLLIGTLHSQYAGRKVKLTGTRRAGNSLRLLTDTNQPGLKMISLSSSENLLEDTDEVTAVELRPDEYDENS